MRLRLRIPLLLGVVSLFCVANSALADARWSKEKANAWYAKTGWLVGCNFGPSSAINQIEMWQAETFDLPTIDRELGWAEGLGFNSVRVFLHDIPWKHDRSGFVRRIDQFLDAAERHKIGVMFVLFDAVWDPYPKPGRQREPKPHLHNSGWVQSPGADILKDPALHDELKSYIQGIIGRYRNDRRVQVWDLFNEPDNPNRDAYGTVELPNKAEAAFELLKKSFAWAKEVNPSQPLTAGVWWHEWTEDRLTPIDRFMLEESDVITYHCYDPAPRHKERIASLRRYGRPMLCTEYMARPIGSTFATILPFLKEENIGAYNWGFVAGDTQTIYPWDSWLRPYYSEPKLWFHDIFRAEGAPYIEDEVRLIREVTGKSRQRANERETSSTSRDAANRGYALAW